ncbi:MAG: nucleotidyltransferase family protein [Vicinamibacteria bacterium]
MSSTPTSIAVELIRGLREQNVELRLFGGLAIALLTRYREVFGEERRVRDIDFVANRNDHRRACEHLLKEGWKPDRSEFHVGISRRTSFLSEEHGVRVEIYADPLVFSHRLDFGSRLRVAGFTLSPADLLLTKLQVADLTKPDVLDIVAILSSCGFSRGSEAAALAKDIECKRLEEVAGADWGLWYTCRQNVEVVLEWMAQSAGLQAGSAAKAADELLETLEEAPKSWKWRARALIGTRLRWYYEVE